MVWRIYAWVVLALVVAGWVAAMFHDVMPYDLINVPVKIVGVTGLFGFAYKRPIGTPAVWRAWMVVQPAWDVSYGLMSGRELPLALLLFAIAYPAYVALFYYGFGSRDVWARR